MPCDHASRDYFVNRGYLRDGHFVQAGQRLGPLPERGEGAALENSNSLNRTS